MPPWVLRMRNSLPPTAAGSQPMPAFWVQLKRSPEGRLRSMSGVMGRAPWGPGDLERTSKRVGSWESRMSGWVGMLVLDAETRRRGEQGGSRPGGLRYGQSAGQEAHGTMDAETGKRGALATVPVA